MLRPGFEPGSLPRKGKMIVSAGFGIPEPDYTNGASVE